MQRILAIETSCDDTSVALVGTSGNVISICSANQDLAHAPFGGVVPEIASRNHTLQILPLVELALEKANVTWQEIDGIAVTNRPGLMGSLMVGVVTAKTLAQAFSKPLIGVNHLEGHILAPFLSDSDWSPPEQFRFPFVALAVSGGHSTIYRAHNWGDYEVFGATLDDAAGEAFDKFAKMMGLGFPGGMQVDIWAKSGNPMAFEFPRSMLKEEGFQMSFSGLKAAASRKLQSLSATAILDQRADLCASFQEAIVDVLINKLDRVVKKTGLKTAVVTGGVSANSRLRKLAQDWADKNKILLVIPPIRYCTDNAAMIGLAGLKKFDRGQSDSLDLKPSPSSHPMDFR